MDIFIISYIEIILYFWYIFFISFKILNGRVKTNNLVISCLFFIPLLFINVFCDSETIIMISGLFHFIEIFLLRFTLSDIKITTIIYLYLLVFSQNLTITSCIDAILNLGTPFQTYLEGIIHAITFTTCIYLCYGKLNNKIKYITTSLSKGIKLIFLAISICNSILAVLLAKDYLYRGISNWNYLARILFISIIILISLVFPIIVTYSLTNKNIKSINISFQKQIYSQVDFYMQLSKSIYDLRQFKHNYKNTNIGLMRLLSEGKSEEALKFLEAQNQDLDSTSVQFDTGNVIVDALLTDKQRQTGNINTTITFEGAVPGDSIEAVDLCIIFGNPMDNAIEACVKMDAETPKEIHISCACNSGFAFIEITNPVQHKVEIRGNLPETTKPDKEMHGFGLYSLEKVIKKYYGEVTCECDETTFKLSMEFSIPLRDS